MGVKYRLKMKKWCSKWCSRQPVNPFTAGTLKEWIQPITQNGKKGYSNSVFWNIPCLLYMFLINLEHVYVYGAVTYNSWVFLY